MVAQSGNLRRVEIQHKITSRNTKYLLIDSKLCLITKQYANSNTYRKASFHLITSVAASRDYRDGSVSSYGQTAEEIISVYRPTSNWPLAGKRIAV